MHQTTYRTKSCVVTQALVLCCSLCPIPLCVSDTPFISILFVYEIKVSLQLFIYLTKVDFYSKQHIATNYIIHHNSVSFPFILKCCISYTACKTISKFTCQKKKTRKYSFTITIYKFNGSKCHDIMDFLS